MPTWISYSPHDICEKGTDSVESAFIPASPISQKTLCTTLHQWISISDLGKLFLFSTLWPQGHKRLVIWDDELHQIGFLTTTKCCWSESLYFSWTKEGLRPSQRSVALNECDKTGRVSTESGCACINEKRKALGIDLPIVQCSPFHPWWHSHLPSLQVPCFTHRGLHTRWSHASPVQPSSQRHAPPIHTPCVPQSTEHTSVDTYKRHVILLYWKVFTAELSMQAFWVRS